MPACKSAILLTFASSSPTLVPKKRAVGAHFAGRAAILLGICCPFVGQPSDSADLRVCLQDLCHQAVNGHWHDSCIALAWRGGLGIGYALPLGLGLGVGLGHMP